MHNQNKCFLDNNFIQAEEELIILYLPTNIYQIINSIVNSSAIKKESIVENIGYIDQCFFFFMKVYRNRSKVMLS